MKMLKLMKRLVRYLILMVIFSITQVVCELYLPSIMSNVVDIGISSANTDYIFSESFKLIIIAIVGLISNIFVVYAASKFSNQYGYNIRKALYEKIKLKNYKVWFLSLECINVNPTATGKGIVPVFNAFKC